MGLVKTVASLFDFPGGNLLQQVTADLFRVLYY